MRKIKTMYLLPVLAAIVLAIFSGCAGAKTLEDTSITQDNLKNQLTKKDVIRVFFKDGKQKNLVVDSLEESYLLGHSNKKNTIIIPYSSIEEIRIYQTEKGKTAARGIGGALIVMFFISVVIAFGI